MALDDSYCLKMCQVLVRSSVMATPVCTRTLGSLLFNMEVRVCNGDRRVIDAVQPPTSNPNCQVHLWHFLTSSQEINSDPDWKSQASKKAERSSNSQTCEKLLGMIPHAQPTSFADKVQRAMDVTDNDW